MEYTYFLQKKLNLAYEIILKYQECFKRKGITSAETGANDLLDKLTELKYEDK